MSRIRDDTKNRIKEDIYGRLTLKPKTVREISIEVNRSWNLTNQLLQKLLEEKKNVDWLKVGPHRTYFLFKKKRYWHYTH